MPKTYEWSRVVLAHLKVCSVTSVAIFNSSMKIFFVELVMIPQYAFFSTKYSRSGLDVSTAHLMNSVSVGLRGIWFRLRAWVASLDSHDGSVV